MRLITRLKDIGKDSFVYGLSQVLSQLVGFLLLPVYTNYLTPEDYGILAMLSLVPILMAAFVNLGLNNAVFRFYHKCNTERERSVLIGTSHVLVFFSSSFTVIFLLLFASPVCYWLTDGTEHLVAFMLIVSAGWFTAISTIPLVVLKQQRKVQQIAVWSLIGLFTNVLVTLFLVVYAGWGVFGSVVGNVVGSAVGTLLLITAVSRATWRSFERGKVHELLRYSLPFVPYFIQAVIMNIIGQYIVKEYSGLTEAGFYSIALRFSLPLVLILNAINNSWAAFKFEIRHNDPDPKKSYRDIFSFYLLFVSVCWLVISLWMPEILKLVINPQYHEAASLIPVLALIPVIQNLRGMLTTGLEMSESPKLMPLITFSGLIILVISCYFLVPQYKALGAVASVVLGWATTAFVTYFYSQKIYPIPYNIRLLCLILLFVLIVFIFPLKLYIGGTDIQAVICKTAIGLMGLISIYLIVDKASYGRRLLSKLIR